MGPGGRIGVKRMYQCTRESKKYQEGESCKGGFSQDEVEGLEEELLTDDWERSLEDGCMRGCQCW